MRLTLKELRQILGEELTKHNQQRLKSTVQSALRVAENYVENMKNNNRDDSITIRDVLAVEKEIATLAKWLAGRNEPDAEPMTEMSKLLKQIGASTDPFKRIFGKATGKQNDQAKRLQPLVVQLHKIAYDNWKVLMYDDKYQNFDDDNARTDFTYSRG